jgi:hypothetical protein
VIAAAINTAAYMCKKGAALFVCIASPHAEMMPHQLCQTPAVMHTAQEKQCNQQPHVTLLPLLLVPAG